ncbi:MULTISPECIES: YnbE family lipoprotein [unclassified Tatumella]|uniref:YnbE family lipoprotein n=1 Tax=unclassified Tatumella TaxID=2649542 RepID=UPI001BB0B642|nr:MULTISPECIES: YnbE family lipoprotein [unclassified Tatumella]MBS0876225.1 YnbE family lipoprotein [Tatumella sp. JGM82]MBS0889274.1 YnbE family lipoprotein [Tatumella sp. JGM94]MBS0893618.1 YnbE family lipoprotein [Tatumella sp. JGM130]MBS0902312.1 YnbE family lipoprotein [Tatumella sp. JGM100]
MKTVNLIVYLLPGFVLCGCVPRIEVAAPKEPITIDMNVRIDHQITVKADKNIETLLSNDENNRSRQGK